jgi:hypothetical protein
MVNCKLKSSNNIDSITFVFSKVVGGRFMRWLIYVYKGIKNLFCLFVSYSLIFSSSLSCSEIEEIDTIVYKSTFLNAPQRLVHKGFEVTEFDSALSGNKVYHIKKNANYVLKLLILDDSRALNREMHITAESGKLDITPKIHILGTGDDFQYILMEYLNLPLLADNTDWINLDLRVIGGIYKKISELHNSRLNFPFHSSPFDYFWNYLDIIKCYKLPIPDYFAEVETCYSSLLPFLMRKEFYGPCHFDLHGHNIFVGKTLNEIKFIDWDCAGMGNMFFELSLFSIRFRLTDIQDELLLRKSYFLEKSLDHENYAAFYIAKTLGLLLASTQEIIRPYFSLFPPFNCLGEVKDIDFSIMNEMSLRKHLPYDDVIRMVRMNEPVKYSGNLEVGLLMMNEAILRAKSDKMRNIKGLLLFKNHTQFLLRINEYLSMNALRSFFYDP